MDVYVLGLDPGFASTGWALLQLHPGGETLIDAGVVRTKPSAKKRSVLASEDNVRRGREITCVLAPLVKQVAVVCAESMSYPRSSSAAAKMAMCWGIAIALTEAHDCPIVQASPQQVKKALCGNMSASKEDIQAVIHGRYPALALKLRAAGVPEGEWEHPFDAAAAVVTAFGSELVRGLRKSAA